MMKTAYEGFDFNVIVPGVVALVLMMFLLGVTGFMDWLRDKTILYVIWFFFSAPIARILIDRKVNAESLAVVGVGVAVLLPYCIFVGASLREVLQSLLEVIVILSLLFTFFTVLKKKLISG